MGKKGNTPNLVVWSILRHNTRIPLWLVTNLLYIGQKVVLMEAFRHRVPCFFLREESI